MGYVAIVVALLLIVMAIVAVAAKGTPSRNSRY